jgi:tetratricopeptide (TPR) repeat protein
MRALLVIAIACALVRPVAGLEPAAKVMNLLEASRLDEAVPLVEAERGKAGLGAFLRGAQALYAGRYAEAAEALGHAIRSGELEAHLLPEAAAMRELAQHTEEVTRDFVARRSAHFEIKVARGKDELLAEPALEALEKALAEIGGDLGEVPPDPIRVEIYGEVADLARVSPLTVGEIETSGTIALCKYNRLMATSPRALIAGYPWLDTLAHELTHYLVNRASRNAVPIWLHEGIAKLEERRWREPFGGALAPTLEHLLASGLREGHLIPFSAMHPSMAKLPSQEDAGLAFAEVTTAIQYLTQGRGAAPLRRLLAALRDGADLEHALQAVTGVGLLRFEQRWRVWVKGRGLRTHPELGMNRLRFVAAVGDKGRKENQHDDEEASEHGAARSPGEARGRSHIRLGTMLRARGRLAAAAVEYERAQQLLGAGHPDVAGRLGRTYLELKQWDRAIAAARPGVERRPESAGLRVTVGRALIEKGDPAAARPFLEGALAVNPYDPTTRCGLRRVYQALSDARVGREAAACAALGGAP